MGRTGTLSGTDRRQESVHGTGMLSGLQVGDFDLSRMFLGFSQGEGREGIPGRGYSCNKGIFNPGLSKSFHLIEFIFMQACHI